MGKLVPIKRGQNVKMQNEQEIDKTILTFNKAAELMYTFSKEYLSTLTFAKAESQLGSSYTLRLRFPSFDLQPMEWFVEHLGLDDYEPLDENDQVTKIEWLEAAVFPVIEVVEGLNSYDNNVFSAVLHGFMDGMSKSNINEWLEDMSEEENIFIFEYEAKRILENIRSKLKSV